MRNTHFDESSLLKDDLNLTDHINRSHSKIENEHPNEEEIHQLLVEAISYLDKDISINTANELFSLIISCFSHYPNQLLPLYNKLLEIPYKNPYHFLITASILSYISRIQPQLSLTEHNSFVDDSLNQLMSQIQKNDENGLKIFDHKNLLIASKLTKNLATHFSPNLFSHNMDKNTSKQDTIYDDISEIHQNIVTNNNFSFESIINDINHIVEPSLRSLLQNDHKNLNSQRSDSIFSKHIQPEQSEINDLQLYLNVFPSIQTRYPFLSTSNFWIHICSIASRSKISISRKMANQFHFYFERFVDESKFDEVLNSIIYSPETQTSIGMEFITQMIFSPKPYIKQNYLYDVKLTELLFKILDTKIALKSCFWRLFSKNLIYREFQNSKNPLLLYGYEFCIGKFDDEFDSIEIKPLTERSIFDLYDYIKNQNYEAKEKMRVDAISLIASAFVFARKEGKISVDGLTKSNVLPFLAVAFNHLNRFCAKDARNGFLINFLNYFKLNQNFALIKQACKSLENNDSPLLLISINQILPHLHHLIDKNNFSYHVSHAIVQILVPFLFNGSYLADKMALLSTVFQFSNKNDQINSEILLLFKNWQLQLFELILKNLTEIVHCDELNGKRLNFTVFDDSVSSFVVESLSKSLSVSDSILFIQFIETFCVNQPPFKFESVEFFEEILDETIQKGMKVEASVVYQFMIRNGVISDFHHLIGRLFLLSNLQQETVQLVNDSLYHRMMLNESISTNYFTFLFLKAVKNGCTNNLSAEQIFNLYSNEFSEFEDTFIAALDCLFVFDQTTKKFILKANYEPSLLAASETSFISNLLSLAIQKSDQFNVFAILKSLAESFPFLFVSISDRVFSAVSKAFECCLFDEKELRAKTAVSALSFLLSLLKLPTILDGFVDFFFSNVRNFNDSQILSCIIVFETVARNDKVKKVLLSKLLKNGFLETVLFIVKRNLNDCTFANLYMEKVCCFTKSFLQSLRTMTQEEAAFVDEMTKVEKPFQTVFDHTIIDLENFVCENEKMAKFKGEIESVKPFWISFDFSGKPSIERNDDQLERMLSKIPNGQKTAKKRSKLLDQIKRPLTVAMIRYLCGKPSWMWTLIDGPENFVLLSEHIEILNETVPDLISIQKVEEIEKDLNSIDKEKLFVEFVLKATTSSKIDNKTFLSFCELFKEISQKECDFESLLKSFQFCLKKSTSLDAMQKMIDVLLCLATYRTFVDKFAILCGNDLIETVMTSKYKNEGEIFLKISQLLSTFDQSQMPRRIVEFIGFILSNFDDSSVVSSSIHLCAKLDENSKKSLNNFVLNLLDKSMEIESKTIEIIPIVIDQFPSICKAKTNKLIEFLDILISRFSKIGDHFTTEIKEDDKKVANIVQEKKQSRCRNEENKASACNRNGIEEDDKKHHKKLFKEEISKKKIKINNNAENGKLLLDLIGAAFRFLAPKRVQPRNVDIEPSSEDDIPDSIFNLSPDFWKLFLKHRPFINETIAKKPILLGSTFSFLLNFPELLDYDIRYSYFVESRTKIARASVLDLTVRPTSILTDSFNLLNPLSTADLTRNLRVKFYGEKERVQNDIYYNELVKELFDPRNYFFVYTENRRRFQINPRSDVIRKHIDYFRFAGKMLARAMLEDHTFNIKITSSVFKMLLKRPLDITDLKDIDIDLHNQLKAKLDEDTPDPKGTDKKNDDGVFFTLGFDDDEEEEEEESNSDDDQISSEISENRNQMYVDSKIEHRLRDPIIDQISAFCDGFYQIIPYVQISSFLPAEFNRLFNGSQPPFSSSAEELINSVEFVTPLHRDSPTCRAFFAVVRSWDDDRFSQLLFFITRSNRSGFKKLKESGNPIKIGLGDEIDLPQSHPFVNLLLLPECDDQNLLNWKFFIAFNDFESRDSPKIRKVRGKKKNSSSVSD